MSTWEKTTGWIKEACSFFCLSGPEMFSPMHYLGERFCTFQVGGWVECLVWAGLSLLSILCRSQEEVLDFQPPSSRKP